LTSNIYGLSHSRQKHIAWHLIVLLSDELQAEIQKVLDLKVPASRIIYANPCKQSSFIQYAAKHNVELMTFDNETELHKVKANHPNAK
jgi:hypothetical protein